MRRLACVFALVATLSAAGCRTTGGDGPPASPPPFPEGWSIVDLTRPLDWRAPALPHPESFPFERIVLTDLEDATWRTGGFAMLEQMGTHMAAPAARGTGETVESVRARDLLLPAVVVDAPVGSPGGQVTEGMLHAHEVQHGLIPAGAAVLLRTGAGSAAPEDPRYAGRNAAGELLFPGWSTAALRFLVETRRARAIGTDAPAVDPASEWRQGPAQTAAAEAGLYCLANLGDLSALPRTGAYLVVGALPIVGGSGAPARVLALIPPPREPPARAGER